jgi:hypothetical protein
MRVRFTAQWYSRARGAWLPVQGASSPWLDAGSAQYVYQQAGWTFFLDPPSPGTHVDVRGVAQMQWLDGGRVARSATSVTTGGVASDVGASAATCTIG